LSNIDGMIIINWMGCAGSK